MSEKLLPCPFCGGEAMTTYNTNFGWQAYCGNDNCFLNDLIMSDCETKKDAIRKWNRRTEPHRLTLEELRRGRAGENNGKV